MSPEQREAVKQLIRAICQEVVAEHDLANIPVDVAQHARKAEEAFDAAFTPSPPIANRLQH